MSWTNKFAVITARKRSLGQGNIFIGVCQEFCSRGEGLLPGGGVYSEGGVPGPGGSAPGGVPGPEEGFAPGGVSALGGVAFCYGLLLWPSVMAFWFGGPSD